MGIGLDIDIDADIYVDMSIGLALGCCTALRVPMLEPDVPRATQLTTCSEVRTA